MSDDYIKLENGLIVTTDEELNKIIRAVEDEKGAKLASAVSAISFEGEDPEEKVYIILLSLYEDGDTTRDWVVKIGRQNTYNYLKDLARSEAIDPNESFIIVGSRETDSSGRDNASVSGANPITVFRFLKVMYENGKVLDEDGEFMFDEYEPFIYGQMDKTILDVC